VPALVRREEIPAPEWTGMLLDGARLPLWDGVAVWTGREVTPAVRLAALGALVPRRAVVGRGAAAWVHAGGPRPARVDVVVPPGARRPDPHPLRRAAEGPLPDEDVLRLGDCRVTTVQRTALDVARYVESAEAVGLLVRLLPLGLDPYAALDTLDAMPGGRGVQRARRLVGELLPLLPPALRRPSGADDRLVGRLCPGDAVDVVDALDAAHGREHRREVRRLGHLEDEP
jgi:hypothetical protein